MKKKSRTKVRLAEAVGVYFTSCCQIASVGPAWFSE